MAIISSGALIALPFLYVYICLLLWENKLTFMGNILLWVYSIFFMGKYRSWEVLFFFVGRFKPFYGMP